MSVFVGIIDRLVSWLTGCWYCQDCGWFGLAVNVVSCVLRAAIIVAILATIVRLMPLGV